MKKNSIFINILIALSVYGCSNTPNSTEVNNINNLSGVNVDSSEPSKIPFDPEKSEFKLVENPKVLNAQIFTLLNNDRSSITTWVSTDNNIYAQRYTKDYKPDGGKFKVNIDPLNNPIYSFPKIIQDKDNGFMISWGNDNKLYIRRYDKNGRADKLEFNPKYVIEDKKFDVLKPLYGDNYILPDKNGNYFIAGTGYNQTGYRGYNHGYSYGQLYDKDFNPINDRIKFLADSTYPTYGLRDSQDNILLIFWRSEQSVAGEGLYGQRFNSDTTPIGEAFRIYAKDINFIQSRNPQVFIDNDDNFIILGYAKSSNNLNYGIYFQKYNLNNKLLFSSEKIDTGKTVHDTFPVDFTRSSVSKNGDIVVTWNGGKELESKIYARRYDKNGNAKDKEEFIVNYLSKGFASNPNVSMNDNSDFLITWSSYNGEETSIYARKYNLNQTLPVDDPALIPKETINCQPDQIEQNKINNQQSYTGELKIKVIDNGKSVELKSKADFENIAKNMNSSENPMIVKIDGKAYSDTTYGLTARLNNYACFDEVFSKYGIKSDRYLAGFYYMNPDYKNAPVSKFEELLRKFIIKQNLTVKEIEFSSPKALAAFSLYMELKLNYSYLFQDLYFSPYYTTSSANNF